jgi:hypothetical protein
MKFSPKLVKNRNDNGEILRHISDLVDGADVEGVEDGHDEGQVNVLQVALRPALVLLDLGHVLDQPQGVGPGEARLESILRIRVRIFKNETLFPHWQSLAFA